MDLILLLEIGSLFLTLMVFLYLIIGDNPLFRLVTYTFIGVASGYVAILVIFQVLLPRIASLVFSGETVLMVFGLIQLILGILLLTKLWQRTSFLGTIPMAILVGIGAAVTIGGAIFGTLFGQIVGTIGIFNMNQPGNPLVRLLEGVFVLIGTISTLAYFQFSVRSKAAASETEEPPARRALSLELLAKVGQVFIGITLGAMFAGVYTAAISAMIERIGFIFDVASRFF
jgi:hypothetical protein